MIFKRPGISPKNPQTPQCTPLSPKIFQPQGQTVWYCDSFTYNVTSKVGDMKFVRSGRSSDGTCMSLYECVPDSWDVTRLRTCGVYSIGHSVVLRRVVWQMGRNVEIACIQHGVRPRFLPMGAKSVHVHTSVCVFVCVTVLSCQRLTTR